MFVFKKNVKISLTHCGKSPFHIATLNGNTQLVIEKGADPNYRDHYVTNKHIRRHIQ
jgi:ankyrin repeat protein